MQRRHWVWIILGSLLTAYLIYSIQGRQASIRSLTYFPTDPTIDFTKASTTLRMEPADASTHYKIHWMTESETNELVYLRQDVSLLFQNGRLVQTSNNWKQNTENLSMHLTLPFEDNSHFEALSVHYAESHEDPSDVKSQEVMSYDHLYVIANAYQNMVAFKVPSNADQKDFQKEITRSMTQEQHYIVEQAAKKFHLKLKAYDVFPLSHLEVYQQNTLPGLNEKTSHRVISQLWEGLYKNYVLGIHVLGSSPESPIGSSMPLILYKKSSDHQILIILHTKSGQLLLLKQTI